MVLLSSSCCSQLYPCGSRQGTVDSSLLGLKAVHSEKCHQQPAYPVTSAMLLQERGRKRVHPREGSGEAVTMPGHPLWPVQLCSCL